MNSFQHLPEYTAAAHSYRMGRTRVERAPRRTSDRPSLLRRLAAALTHHQVAPTVPAVR